MKTLFPVLENYVDATYDGAIRMLKLSGFSLSSPEKTTNGNEFVKFTLRNI